MEKRSTCYAAIKRQKTEREYDTPLSSERNSQRSSAILTPTKKYLDPHRQTNTVLNNVNKMLVILLYLLNSQNQKAKYSPNEIFLI